MKQNTPSSKPRGSLGNVSRRTLMKGATMLAGTAASCGLGLDLVPTAEAKAAPARYVARSTTIVASPSKNVVETDSGKIYGYLGDGVITFKGIPYGASTEGSGRFMPPSKPAPWPGVRSALYWGPVSPQPITSTFDGRRAGWGHDREAFMFDWDDGHDSEDCLRLNVWTRSINDNSRRPVMVWLHGGGYEAGSSQELRMYPGENLVRRGDVVSVSLNHRLGVLGFANLRDFGTQYASSPNVGMLDLVAALQWIKTNIANFGGDPGRVMIFGQSGGGGKVSTLMAMPSAKGLVHRAAVQSGSLLDYASTESSARVMASVLAELGLTRRTIGRIHEIPYQRIIEAAVRSERVLAAEGDGAGELSWGPVEDGQILPLHSWEHAPAYSAHVPLIVGSVLNEFFNSVQMDDPAVDSWSMAEVRQRLGVKRRGLFSFGLGDGADHVIDVARKVYPHASPFTIYSIISATGTMRWLALTQAARKAAQGAAPAYNYWFRWQTPILDGQARAFHCSELPFVFYNTERCASMTGGGPEALDLGARMADSWIAFARDGDPNHNGLPHWQAYDAKTVPTMVFDNHCVLEHDPDGEVRRAIEEAFRVNRA
jgi:para-nitrobenzyl esterase